MPMDNIAHLSKISHKCPSPLCFYALINCYEILIHTNTNFNIVDLTQPDLYI